MNLDKRLTEAVKTVARLEAALLVEKNRAVALNQAHDTSTRILEDQRDEAQAANAALAAAGERAKQVIEDWEAWAAGQEDAMLPDDLLEWSRRALEELAALDELEVK